MSLIIRPGDRIGIIGTSLTSGIPPTTQPRGWWRDVLDYGLPLFRGYNAGGRVTALASSPFARTPATVARPVIVHVPTVAEIAGAKVSDNVALWDTLVGNYGPIDTLIAEGNINDTYHDTPEQDFRDSIQELFALALAAGATQILWLGAMFGYITGVNPPNSPGEKWSLYAGDAFQLKIDQYNTWVSEEVATLGSRGMFVNLRPALQALEPTVNPGDLGSGVYTSDGVHLTNLGLFKVAELARPSFTFEQGP